MFSWSNDIQGRIQDFKLGEGAHLKKLRRAERGVTIVGGGWGAGAPPAGSAPDIMKRNHFLLSELLYLIMITNGKIMKFVTKTTSGV